MQGYSISGYLNAVMRRTDKTILVEGVTDRSVLLRLKSHQSAVASKDLPGLIDIAELISDDEIAGFGKKEVIQTILSKLASLSRASAAVTNKFGTLTDREWDGLSLDLDFTSPWFEPTQQSPNFTTIGHSVENYFFRLELIETFLRQFFSDHLTQRFFNLLHQRFNAVIGFAVIYSLVLKSINAVRRADRLISRDMVEWHGDCYLANPSLNAGLHRRGVRANQNVFLRINSVVNEYFERYTSTEPGRWLCHGHLGDQAIWSCIAHLARETGVANDVAEQIERGLRDVRLRHCADYLCRNDERSHVPLDLAINWLVT